MAATAPPPKATYFTSPAKGSGVRGLELDRCYDGAYVNGKRHGFGTYTYANSFFTYQGDWDQGEKHGLGKLSMRDGGYYEGEFVRGEIIGKGRRVFANGNCFDGTFEMGEMHGFGIMTFANGDVYQGPVVHNCFQGEGVFTFAATGDRYQGDFRDHRMTGRGTMHYANGDKYVGDWVDGKRSGQGFCTYANGDTYQGEWGGDAFHGQGTWDVARFGLRYAGAFEAGRPTTVPTRLSLLYDVTEDPKAAKAKKPPAKGEVELPPPLQVTIGQPLATPLTLAAQFEAPLPPPPEPDAAELAAAAAADKKGGAKKAAAAAAAPAGPVTVYTEPPPEGWCYQTAGMESNRVVNLTLHREPPGELPAGLAVRVLLTSCWRPAPGGGEAAAAGQAGEAGEESEAGEGGGEGGEATAAAAGEVVVRLLLLFAGVDAPLPLARAEGQAVTSLQYVLAGGQRALPDLVLGSAEDAERLAVPGGVAYLVASSWGVARGYCRLTGLPEYKAPPAAKKPPGK